MGSISLTHLYTNDKSTLSVPFLFGVPTQIKIISDAFIAFFKSVVKIKRLALKFFLLIHLNLVHK